MISVWGEVSCLMCGRDPNPEPVPDDIALVREGVRKPKPEKVTLVRQLALL